MDIEKTKSLDNKYLDQEKLLYPSSYFIHCRLSKDKYSLLINWKQVPLAFINAIKRIMHSELPTVAIEEVTVKQNTTLYPNDFLEHRLRYLPLQIDNLETINKMVFREKCDCFQSFCQKCAFQGQVLIQNITNTFYLFHSNDISICFSNDDRKKKKKKKKKWTHLLLLLLLFFLVFFLLYLNLFVVLHLNKF